MAHLRIENRALPAGPTIVDEVANAAFFFGLMTALGDEYADISRVMEFDHAHANFMAAARYGLHARLKWVHGRDWRAEELILEELLPRAREGLRSRKLRSEDVDHYLGVLEERVKTGRTGAQWALDSLGAMAGKSTRDARYRALTAAILRRQWTGEPVHTWELARAEDATDWRWSYRTVGQVMSTDLFTVNPEDLVDLAANLMDWEHLRHVPVEDEEGQLVGIVSHRALLRMVARGQQRGTAPPVAVREIMRTELVTCEPETSTLEAIYRMREHRVSCLPVVKGGKLVGIVTEHDFIRVAAGLLEEKLREA